MPTCDPPNPPEWNLVCPLNEKPFLWLHLPLPLRKSRLNIFHWVSNYHSNKHDRMVGKYGSNRKIEEDWHWWIQAVQAQPVHRLEYEMTLDKSVAALMWNKVCVGADGSAWKTKDFTRHEPAANVTVHMHFIKILGLWQILIESKRTN